MTYNLVIKSAPTLAKTKALQELWGFGIPESPLINIEDVKGCHTQIKDELQELVDDVIEGYYEGKTQDAMLRDLLDVCIDMQVYIEQLIVRSGLTEQFNDAYDKIYRNNSTKVCTNLDDAIETQKMYEAKGINTIIEHNQVHDVYIVKDSVTHHVKKPIGFKPVEL